MAKKVQNSEEIYIDRLVKSIQMRCQLISRSLKLDSGIESTRVVGFSIGFVLVFLFVVVIPVLVLRVFGI
ncbi:tetrahydromethanopterin S-methyltransferase subunit F [Methanolapillus millepedarum]|uniref:Tetrahydromethanopterin S-methyltransferase F subunit domain-containing protein n=1 Tax=Methanolapillus millepedarum TaxID=3028296 RepID=A0AA96V3D8_9EURY|nr:hypothetical protein MsAc7_13300 [Methanosarcinaceae archaeon Ac7]